MAKTNAELVKYAHKALAEGWKYWYGVTGLKCTQSRLESKARQYPAHYTAARMPTYQRHIAEGRWAADCINLVKGFMWLDEATGEQRYASNNCPDTNADGMFKRAKEKGDISTMPDIPGLIVRFAGHAGVYVGSGMVIEARGFNYGVVLTELKKRPWTHWYKLHCLSYTDNLTESAGSLLGARTLRRGMSGEDVREMQTLIMANGFGLSQYGADGDFGDETEGAVRLFQKKHGLTVDGIYGEKSHETLMAVSNPDGDETEEEAAPQTPAAEKRVRVTGGSVRIRKGPGTQYDTQTFVRRDMELRVIGESGGWFNVDLGNMTGWIGPKYTEVIT